MTKTKLERKVNFLTAYVIAITLLCCFLAFSSFRTADEKRSLDELTVKRINIVDEEGNLRMVISNEKRQHPGRIDGKDLPSRQRPSGIIFFNSFGDECGGLVYDGNAMNAGMVLSVDKFRDDQLMQLQYVENTMFKQRKYGLQLWDYPKENTYAERVSRYSALDTIKSSQERKAELKKMDEDCLLMEDRLFIGKNFKNDVGLFINDQQGNPRIRIYVDKSNTPVMEFLDENGEIIKR